VDLINSGDPVRRAREVEALGVDIVCVHTAFDVQHVADPLETLRRVSGSEHRSVHFD
jgi:3-hexulose-6-phosphate synthase